MATMCAHSHSETSSISHHAVNEILDCTIENLLNQSGDLAPSDMEEVQVPHDSNVVMPFGDISMMFVPPIQGEFTNLLFQAHHETATSRHLDFDQGPNTSTTKE
uniref:Uncharacterized protein n=1 Tax=Leersia perrieri TaxID=77586 RepID=A0A0D9VI67_9ORYZ